MEKKDDSGASRAGKSVARGTGDLDQLGVPCAFLNGEGLVESANASWRQEGIDLPMFAEPGSNFTETIGTMAMSRRTAEGVREVIDGRTRMFAFDITSRGTGGGRWFRLLASHRLPTGASVVIVDITDHHRQTEILREREVHIRRVLESIQEHAILAVDADGRIITWSQGAQRIFGHSADEISGQPAEVLYTPEDRRNGRPAQEIADALRSGRGDREGWRIRKDGTLFWGSSALTALHDAAGAAQGLSIVVRDLTDRRRIDGNLRESESHLASIVDSAMDAIITVDESQRIVMFNHAAERIFGAPASEAIGSSLERFIPERYRRGHSEHVRAFGTTGVTTRAMGRLGTLYGLRGDGREFPIEASISQAVTGGSRFYTVILRDISERRLLEEQLIQAQKMEGIGRLAGGVAHDFNNLLTVIFGYLGVAAATLEPGHRAQDALAHTREAAERAANLTRQLLAFARKHIYTPRTFGLREVVATLEPMLRRLIGEDLVLRTVLAPDTGHVRADVGQFEQVVMNLTVNARDAMPNGGTLTIETANVVLDEAYCRTRVGATPGDHVMLAVTDTGVGMTPEILERLFEPFFTTKGPGKGTGLGLATCHGVIRQSAGHIAVYSEPGRGTSVKVFLPRQREGEASGGQARVQAPAPGGSETILLVEDNAMVRDLVCDALQQAGYRVLPAENGPTAIELAAATPEAIALLITDVVMPEMNGVQVAEALALVRPRLKVLYMSGYTEETIIHHGVETETMAFLPKPFSVDAMLRKIRSVLQPRQAHGS